MKYHILAIFSVLSGFISGRLFEKSNPKPAAFTLNTMQNAAPALICLIDTNGSQFADIEIKPGRSVNLYGIDQVSMLSFRTNQNDGSVFIHDWKRTNFGIRIWPGRN